MISALYLDPARLELAEAVAYYEARSPGLGTRFMREVQQAVEELRALPEASPVLRDEIRQKLLRKFPYSILYALDSGTAVIVAVMHHRRRPDYWLPRTAELKKS